MNASSLDRNENGPAKAKSVETTVSDIEEVNLFVEELEDVIAPKIVLNHNEAMVSDEEIELEVEEIEDVIAPRIALNHNETMVSDSE
ncbi:MAG: hypothetical protein M3410_02655 [Acidobacteriota bacterium]|nr:hypothetical protein [Acidobacteriota bacterium]